VLEPRRHIDKHEFLFAEELRFASHESI
jgi:hypothetical protein